MAKLYRQHVLKEAPTPELVTLDAIKPAPKPVEHVEEQEEVGALGD